MSPPYWAWQGGDVGGDREVCLFICLIHLNETTNKQVKWNFYLKFLESTWFIQSLGKCFSSSMQRGLRLRFRESHGL